jgi:prepilin-type N-terminal cleavage/methylation domain-containing protein
MYERQALKPLQNPMGNKKLLLHTRNSFKMKNGPGFTTIELVIVIAIVAILMAIVIPNTMTWRTTAQFNAAVREVKARISDMRMFAIKNNTRGDVTFVNGASNFITIEYDRVGGAVNALVANPQVHQLNAQVTLTSTFGGGLLRFNNRGMTATPGTVTVNGPNALSRTITVSFAGSSQVQ